MLKASPVADYPTEAGCFLRGNDYSPVAVVVLLNAPYGTLPPEVQSIPPEIEKLVRVAIETGAALSGTLQTENIGIEKIVCNVVGNPNIRYLILAGRESGHFPADALKALFKNGTDEKGYILNTKAPTAILKNIPKETIERLRRQIQLIDLTGIINVELLEKAVWSCYQEKEIPFEIEDKRYLLYDIGPFKDEPIIYRLTDKLKS